MEISTEYDLYSRVYIYPLELSGTIDVILYDGAEIQYRVRYPIEREMHTAYFFGYELLLEES